MARSEMDSKGAVAGSEESSLSRTLRESGIKQPRRRRSARFNVLTIAKAFVLGSLQTGAAKCISLEDSTVCSAFNASSISTDDAIVGLFPFLSSVSNVKSFDSGLNSWISDGYAQVKYQQLLDCSNFEADNTTDFYARYTASVLCNSIVQNSIQACSLSGRSARPLCAESCAAYAESEEQIAASNICGGSTGADARSQIRADFTNCALPANALTGQCIEAVENQPDNCGYNTNLSGLCSYCAASSPNSTDSCCVFSETEKKCKGVSLPVVATSALRPVTGTGGSHATGAAAGGGGSNNRGLTGGQIAGIVVGSVLGALVLLALIIFGCLLLKRRRQSSPPTSVFNQPTPMRQGQPSSSQRGDSSRDKDAAGLAVVPGGRVARMSALEGPDNNDGARYATTDDEEDSPGYAAALAPPPKRSGSLSSASQLAVLAGPAEQDTSPSTNEQTSPESQSEQLGFFKDYYSQDEIRPGDLVATLWAYEPRAADEFHLERGDMIKVIGIWDDGWATGVRVRQRADEWRSDDKIQRDSALGGESASQPQPPQPPDSSEGAGSEVKAFPLVCVCLPQHWRKTIEGESTEGSGPPDFP